MQVYINSSESITISRICKLAKTIEENKTSNGINWSEEILRMKDCSSKCLNDYGLEEQKSTRIQESDMSFYDNPLLNKKGKEPLFYGSAGFLSFCQAIFSLSNNTKNTLNLFEDINTLLKKFGNNKQEVDFDKRKTVGYIIPQKLDDTHIPYSTIGSSVALYASKDEIFMSFSNPAASQFFLLCAIYCCRYQPQPAQIVNVIVNTIISGT
jgi:hypothetical protein